MTNGENLGRGLVLRNCEQLVVGGFVRALGIWKNPLEIHCSKIKQGGQRPWLKCTGPWVFISAKSGRMWGSVEPESCGTENNMCLPQVPEKIIALARRGRGQA